MTSWTVRSVACHAAVLATLYGCGLPATEDAPPAEGAVDGGAAAPSFEAVFERIGTIVLAEPDTAIITGILGVSRRPDGLLAVPDFQESQVRVYLPNGELYANLGRKGEGPGEFRAPSDVAFSLNGSLYVIELGGPRVTRFSPSFALDTIFNASATVLGPMRTVGERVILGHLNFYAPPDSGFYGVYAADGTRQQSFHRPPRSLYEEPYWMSAIGAEPGGTFRLAVLGGRAVVANPILYRLKTYPFSGEPGIEFGTPPPSWKQITQVEPSHFTGRPVTEFDRWVAAASRIDRLEVYRDSVVLVAHRTATRPDGERGRRLDGYLADGTALFSDLPIPGRLVMADSAVAFLTREAPFPWTIEFFRISLGRDGL